MPKFRPIAKEEWSEDRIIRAAYAIHENQKNTAAPDLHAGALVTVPATAGVKVKGAVGGGTYNPPKGPQQTLKVVGPSN